MKKRYVKRIIQKILLLVILIFILSIITSIIVEKRLKRQVKTVNVDDVTEVATDQNGDPVTEPFKAPYKIPPTKRRPRPPVLVRHFLRDFQENQQKLNLTHLVEVKDQFIFPSPTAETHDWHDYVAMSADQMRVGLGEHGQPAYINDESMKEIEKELSLKNGFNALLSDAISVNRSLPDVRKEACKTKQYLSRLPKASIIITFFNEHFSVLLRTLHSIMNRTPHELLKEILLVDDGSEYEDLKANLEAYVGENFADMVNIVRLSSRTGLISARLAGADKARGDVLVFLDSHVECNYNWLPPLLEPIAMNEKICTCPIVDVIDHATFAYNGGFQEGSRGGFDWNFAYKQLPVLPSDQTAEKINPYRNPVMMGGLFAISRSFFWDLGGYDPHLEIWGAEQYELSFKIWMCGGMLLDVPCSRVAHVFRGPWNGHTNNKTYNFVAKNNKRVAEVWMDEYKEYIYMRDPDTYAKIETGDLSDQIALRKRLQCKSFKWFMEVVAPDLLISFPPIPPPAYAYGAIQNLAYPQYCLDTLSKGNNHAVGLYTCAENKTHPQRNQYWELSWHRDLRLRSGNQCLDVHYNQPNATVWMWSCHNQGGNQFWYYDQLHKWLVHGQSGHNCLEALIDADGKPVVYANACDSNNPRMQWTFGVVNETALNQFHEF